MRKSWNWFKKSWRSCFAFGFWGAVLSFDLLYGAWGWFALHLGAGFLAIVIGDLSVRYSNARLLRRAVAAWGGNEPDIDGEWQATPPPPKDWYLLVRGERYDNIELVYLGPILIEGNLCSHWRAVRPVTMPADVQLHEIAIRGQAALGQSLVIDLWLHRPQTC